MRGSCQVLPVVGVMLMGVSMAGTRPAMTGWTGPAVRGRRYEPARYAESACGSVRTRFTSSLFSACT